MFNIMHIFKKKNTPTTPAHPLIGNHVTYMNAMMTQPTPDETEVKQIPTINGVITKVINSDTLQVLVGKETGTYTRFAPHFPYFKRTDLQGNPNKEQIILA